VDFEFELVRRRTVRGKAVSGPLTTTTSSPRLPPGDARVCEAADRVVELWPAEPDDVDDLEPPPPPPVPPGSWFERN
jgi:hypothetical protein